MAKKTEKQYDNSAEEKMEKQTEKQTNETIKTEDTPKSEESETTETETKNKSTEEADANVESSSENHEKDDCEELDEKTAKIKELELKNNELNDKYLRLFSEFDNFRKRTMKEKLELTKTASADIIQSILPVVDDLDRAYQSSVENPDADIMAEGINLIQSKLKTTLKHKGLEEITCEGEEFNTDLHEAITHIPASKPEDKGKVMETVQKGYLLNGKVLRFAKVVVAN